MASGDMISVMCMAEGYSIVNEYYSFCIPSSVNRSFSMLLEVG